MDDCDARILAKLIRQGNLPNLKSLDVSDNQITPTGEGYFAGALQSINQAISITLVKVQGFSIDALKVTMKSMLSTAHSNGISTKEMLTTDETIEHCKKVLLM
jgi:Leucine-rich repeat (LRR) protein